LIQPGRGCDGMRRINQRVVPCDEFMLRMLLDPKEQSPGALAGLSGVLKGHSVVVRDSERRTIGAGVMN